MQRIPQVRRDQEESFFSEELACDFCTQTATTAAAHHAAGNQEIAVPPCHRCQGLIYALKSKMYFIIT